MRESTKIKITVAGPVGSGTSTVATLLKEALWLIGIPVERIKLSVAKGTECEGLPLELKQRRFRDIADAGTEIEIETVSPIMVLRKVKSPSLENLRLHLNVKEDHVVLALDNVGGRTLFVKFKPAGDDNGGQDLILTATEAFVANGSGISEGVKDPTAAQVVAALFDHLYGPTRPDPQVTSRSRSRTADPTDDVPDTENPPPHDADFGM